MNPAGPLVFRNFNLTDFIWVPDSHILEIDSSDVISKHGSFSSKDFLEVESPLTGVVTVLQSDEIKALSDDESYAVIYRPLCVSENFEIHLYYET